MFGVAGQIGRRKLLYHIVPTLNKGSWKRKKTHQTIQRIGFTVKTVSFPVNFLQPNARLTEPGEPVRTTPGPTRCSEPPGRRRDLGRVDESKLFRSTEVKANAGELIRPRVQTTPSLEFKAFRAVPHRLPLNYPSPPTVLTSPKSPDFVP